MFSDPNTEHCCLQCGKCRRPSLRQRFCTSYSSALQVVLVNFRICAKLNFSLLLLCHSESEHCDGHEKFRTGAQNRKIFHVVGSRVTIFTRRTGLSRVLSGGLNWVPFAGWPTSPDPFTLNWLRRCLAKVA